MPSFQPVELQQRAHREAALQARDEERPAEEGRVDAAAHAPALDELHGLVGNAPDADPCDNCGHKHLDTDTRIHVSVY